MTTMLGHNSAITAYDEFRAQLGELRETNAAMAFDYADPKGNKEARSHVYKLRQTKSAVESARKKEKAASLEYGRRVDEQAKEIVTEIEGMIEVHEKPIREIEQREKDRVERHKFKQAQIEQLGQDIARRWMELSLDAMKGRLGDVEAIPTGEDYWEEFAPLAAPAIETALASIRDAIDRREKYDAEQAELERLRVEAEERRRQDHEESIRKEAAQRATKEAERKAQQEQERKEADAAREREASERRERELTLAAEAAEREKVEAEQRAAAAEKETEERLRREATELAEKEAAETARREADKKHRSAINRGAVAALVKGGLSDDAAKQAVTLIAQKAVPNITISY